MAAPNGPSWDLLLISAAALILIGVARLHSFVPFLAALRPALLFAILGLVALFLDHRGPRSVRLLEGLLAYLMAFLLIWAVLTAPFGLYSGNSVRFLTNAFLRTTLVTLLIAASVRNVADLRALMKVYALGAIAFALLAQGSGGFRDLRGGGYDANDSALFIVSGIPIVLFFLFRSRRLASRALFGLGLLACASAVVISGSRSGFLALVAVLGFSLFFLKGLRPMARAVAVVVVVGTVSVQATGEFWERIESTFDTDDYNWHSYGGRIELWKRGAEYMFEHPLTGVGINNFFAAEAQHPVLEARLRSGYGAKYSAPHSIWVQAGSELGIPGFLAFAGIFVVALRLLWPLGRFAGGGSRARGDPELMALGEISRPLIGVIIGVLVAGTFLSFAFSPLAWTVMGFTLAVGKLLKVRRFPARRLPSKPHWFAPHRTSPHVDVGAGRILGTRGGQGASVAGPWP